MREDFMAEKDCIISIRINDSYITNYELKNVEYCEDDVNLQLAGSNGDLTIPKKDINSIEFTNGDVYDKCYLITLDNNIVIYVEIVD